MSDPVEERWFTVVSPSVVSEVIDGEAVIMDLRSGYYFSTRETGALIWSWIERGISDREIAQRLVVRFEIESDKARTAVAEFTEELLRNDLVRPGAPDSPMPADVELPDVVLFTAPVMATYTDMQDLLLLDPIHDVDKVGWPTRRDDTAV